MLLKVARKLESYWYLDQLQEHVAGQRIQGMYSTNAAGSGMAGLTQGAGISG